MGPLVVVTMTRDVRYWENTGRRALGPVVFRKGQEVTGRLYKQTGYLKARYGRGRDFLTLRPESFTVKP